MSGIAGRPFSEVLGPGDCCAADSPRAPTGAGRNGGGCGATGAARLPRPAARRRRRRRAAADCCVDGLPILKPPYGTISAINLDRGEIVWQVPHGDTPDNVRNHPALKGLTIPKTGQAGTGGIGLMVTKTLVVMGDPQIDDDARASARRDAAGLREDSGKEVGAVWMAAPQSGSPMTYLADGKQYIVVAISGGNYSGEYVAFTLPGR